MIIDGGQIHITVIDERGRLTPLHELERQVAKLALSMSGGSKVRAAELLDIGTRRLTAIMREPDEVSARGHKVNAATEPEQHSD